MPQDQVRANEDLFHFAKRHGFYSIDGILDANTDALRGREQGVLRTGEWLEVPAKTPYSRTCMTGRRHVFVRRSLVMPLRLLVLDDEGEPFDEGVYTLELEGVGPKDDTQFQGMTDGDGVIDVVIPIAKAGMLTLWEGDEALMEIPLSFGGLEPIEDVLGVKRRLANLGFPVDDVDDDSNWSETTNESLLHFIVTEGATVEQPFFVPGNQQAMQFVRARLLLRHDGIGG